MPIWRETSSGPLRRWAPSDETLELLDIELVHYYSDGYRIAADVYKPKGTGEGDKRGGIVIVPGFTVIKETALPVYGEAFAREGYVCIAFDFRGFGESDGRRGDSTWQSHVDDTRNAITFLQHYPGVDPERIGFYGLSYGGKSAMFIPSIVEGYALSICSGDFNEEVWKHLPASSGEAESVYLSPFPEYRAEWADEALSEKWEKIWEIRAAATKALEEARREKVIGLSLDAHVHLYLPEKTYQFIQPYEKDLKFLFIVSGVTLHPETAKEEKSVRVEVVRADGQKCERCWNFDRAVGSEPRHPTICGRCIDVIEGGR